MVFTVGRWSWKSKSAKECVITHLPNGVAPKMDGAEACRVYVSYITRLVPYGVGGCGDCDEIGLRSQPQRYPVQISIGVASNQVQR